MFVIADANVLDKLVLRNMTAPKERCEELSQEASVDFGKHEGGVPVDNGSDSIVELFQNQDCIVIDREMLLFAVATNDGVIVDSVRIPVSRSISADD